MNYYMRFMVAYALCAFILSAFLPIWTAYYFGAWEISGETTWFLVMIDSLIRAAVLEQLIRLI